jgi:uncharacterized protein YggE
MKQILALLTLMSSSCLFGALTDVPHMTLSASASLKKPADELQLKIAVITHSENADEALEKNSSHMRQIIDSIQELGLYPDEYETAQFSINPTYTPYPTNPPANWRPSINGYEVNNTIFVHTCQLDLIGSVIDVATKSGASSISDIRFGLKDPRQYYSEALTLAGKRAVHEAQIMAAATGVKLKRVLSINMTQMRVNSPQVPMACFVKAACNDAAPPIEAGDLSIEAHVNLIYEIE